MYIKGVFTRIIRTLLTIYLVSCQGAGGHYLGNNIYVTGGATYEVMIVFCNYSTWVDGCRAGLPIIPIIHIPLEASLDFEYVKTENFDNDWIIATTIYKISKKERFWIMSKSFDAEEVLKLSLDDQEKILRSHIFGPLTFDEFAKLKDSLGIEISFK